jgi:hypothetical protein
VIVSQGLRESTDVPLTVAVCDAKIDGELRFRRVGVWRRACHGPLLGMLWARGLLRGAHGPDQHAFLIEAKPGVCAYVLS